MNRKRMVWIALLPLVGLLVAGCPKKKPQAAPEQIAMETKQVQPPTQEMPAEPTAPAMDQTEHNPLESEDLRVVNEEAQRQGFAANVYFDFDKSELKPEAREGLAANAEFLRNHPEFVLIVEGHCDERGTNEYNLALGERRANAAKDYLTSLGVAAGRLNTISYGEERPVCTQSDESCWSQNRRAHMVITGRSR
jgi:peptidoglycan-associated lipoprotein